MNRPLARLEPLPLHVPAAPRRVQRLILLGLGTLGLAAAGLWAAAMGHPQRALLALATAGAKAGLSVRQVELSGDRHQSRLSIYREVLSGGSDSMLLLDVADLRRRLLALPWVLEADVHRRWPDTIVIRLVEREPVAIWQAAGRYRLIDSSGRPLPPIPLEDFRHLPLVAGAGADEAAPRLLRLLADHPQIAAGLLGARRVGERRWDLRMRTGETILLPEDARAPAALRAFATAHAQSPLLGQGFISLDLRIENRLAVRLAPDARAAAGKARTEAAERQRLRQQPGASSNGRSEVVA
ncbi:cell division protein FtsQ/DivIB [Thermaurantiacus sp.]